MESETHGIRAIGEVPVVIRRDSVVEADHSQAYRSGREAAFQEVLAYARQQHERTGRYDDTRPWIEIRLFLTDKIKETADGATQS
jgi:hypothetical protein